MHEKLRVVVILLLFSHPQFRLVQLISLLDKSSCRGTTATGRESEASSTLDVEP